MLYCDTLDVTKISEGNFEEGLTDDYYNSDRSPSSSSLDNDDAGCSVSHLVDPRQKVSRKRKRTAPSLPQVYKIKYM